MRWRSSGGFLAVEVSTLLSGGANGVTVVVLPWLVLELTGSPVAAAGLAALTAIPIMLSAVGSGTIVDLFGRRLVSVTSDVLSLIAVAALPILDLTIGLNYPMVVALAILGAAFDPPGFGAKESMIPEAAEAAGLRLERANSIHEAVWGVAFLIGPGIGGLMIGLVGAPTTLWVTAGMFAVCAAVAAMVKIPGGGKPANEDRPSGYWQGTQEGLGWLWRDRPLRDMALIMMVLVALYLPVEGVALPVYYQGKDAPTELGLVLMGLSGGGIVGALAYGALSHRLSRRAWFVGALACTAIAFIPMAFLPALPIMVAAAAFTGLAFGPVNPVLNVVMQTRTPNRMRGRVVGTLTAAQYAAGPLGYILAGPAIDSFGVSTTMQMVAAGFVMVAIAAALTPSLRGLDESTGREAIVPPVEETPPPRPMG